MNQLLNHVLYGNLSDYPMMYQSRLCYWADGHHWDDMTNIEFGMFCLFVMEATR